MPPTQATTPKARCLALPLLEAFELVVSSLLAPLEAVQSLLDPVHDLSLLRSVAERYLPPRCAAGLHLPRCAADLSLLKSADERPWLK